ITAGVGRVFIEFFRPDQPKIGDLVFSYSSLVFALMAIAGVLLLMARYKVIQPKFAENWEEEYKLSSPADQMDGMPVVSGVRDDPTMKKSVIEEKVAPAKKKSSTPKPKSTVSKKAAPKKSAPKVE